MAEREDVPKANTNTTTDVLPKPGYKFLSVWTIPVGKHPSVRIEVGGRIVRADRVFQIACNILGIYPRSRKLFGLFRGSINPKKKYGVQENIVVPCKATLTIQRWSFDLMMEKMIIKTDAVAFRLMALQIISEIENGKRYVSPEEMRSLKVYLEPGFECYKQFIEEAQKLESYSTLTVKDVEVQNEAHFVTSSVPKGTILDIVLDARKLLLRSETVKVAIPWRKIRQFVEVNEKKIIYLEVFLENEKKFTWIEFQSTQRVLIIQAIAECIDMIHKRVEKPVFPQPEFVRKKKRNSLSLSLIQTEMFGIGRKKEVFGAFDDIDLGSSEEEEGENDVTSSSSSST